MTMMTPGTDERHVESVDARAVIPETRVADLAPAAALFHGLADPTRLMILNHLRLGEHRVRDLTEHLGLAQSTVSAHLACLRDCGLVVSRPQGRASMFSLTSVAELREVFAAAEVLLGATGHGSHACPADALEEGAGTP